MQVTIIKKNKLDVFSLPEEVNGNYWITSFENGKKINLINIEAKDDKWQLISNSNAYVVDENDKAISSVELKNYSFLAVKDIYTAGIYYIYTSPIYDDTFKELKFPADNNVTVGKGKDNDICYSLDNIPENAFSIDKEGNDYYVNIKESIPLYINKNVIQGKQKIEYGDVLFAFGLKLILIQIDGVDYLLVNNPNNALRNNINFANISLKENTFVEKNEELSEDATKESNYFYRTPYFYRVLNKYELSLDGPPNKKEEDDTPLLLTIGPMMTMAMTSVVMLVSVFINTSNSNTPITRQLPTIAMSVTMLLSSILWPSLTKKFQKKKDKEYEENRQKLYRNYLNTKENEINAEIENQRKLLNENNLSVLDCQAIIKNHGSKLWQRRITDENFLSLPVGKGNVKMEIEIKYPEEHFSMTSDTLLDEMYNFGKRERMLLDVPIVYSFKDSIATGIVGDTLINQNFIDRLILQLMTNYGYDELKIVTLTSKDKENSWDYMKVLPHSWNNDRSFRFFGSSNDDYREIIYILEKIYNERKKENNDKKEYDCHYVIITDSIKSVETYDFIKDIMQDGSDYGFSIIMLVNKTSALPNECKNFIEVYNDECRIFNSVINDESQKFKIDNSPIDDLYGCAKELSNIPIDIKTDVESKLPDVLHFLEMYQVGKVEQLNVSDRWKKSNPIISLQAPVGVGKSGELISLDLHEKFHGPHGLVAGTTGSGKSEFLITFILSLAVNYNPNEVQVILIDYKGGGLANAFSNGSYKLPHVAGTMTNLDGNELNRSLASIESEVKRRQREFNDAKMIANESTMDIYKYQRLYREGKLGDKGPIAHLIIISDEFAELKEQQPEFMDKLISVARIGRSLGVHLILATQKPAGVVNGQIWSNSRFRVCLKVQDTSDSQEVLKKPDAAYLQKQGRFYLQVGTDEVYTLGQSSWSGGQYYPNTTFKKEMDVSVKEINNIGMITKIKESKSTEKVESLGEELPNIVKYISNVSNNLGIKVKKLWLDRIPDKIYIDDLKKKYMFTKKDYYLNPVIGEYDDPDNQEQYLLTVPFSKNGNAMVYGMADSGSEEFLTSLIYSCITTYTPQEVNVYIVDCGAETLKVFNKFPHVGDVAFLNDSEKIKNLFKMINNELEVRKKAFSEYGGSYNDYIKYSDGRVPNVLVVINNYEAFLENYDQIGEELNKITREAFKYGIFFLISANAANGVRSRVKQNFALSYVLQQNNEYDYMDLLGNVRGKLPAKVKGRGLFKIDKVFEFQTALIVEENEKDYLMDIGNKYMSSFDYKALSIPILPEKVDYEYISKLNTKDIIIGVYKQSLETVKYDLEKGVINLISTNELENAHNFVEALINQLNYKTNYETIIINTTEESFNTSSKVYNQYFNEIIENYSNYTDSVEQMYNQDISSVTNLKKHVIFIYGLKNFIEGLNPDNLKKFASIIDKNSKLKNVYFILIDIPANLKKYAFDEWYKTNANTTRGVWIGSGVVEQQALKVSKYTREDYEEIPKEFGYIIENSKINRAKLLESFYPKNE